MGQAGVNTVALAIFS
ncbi:hypothetical protein VIB10_03840 [Bifidobacterium longum]|uniref:Fragment of beta galactosidase n=2 Tax=Bifidobacterium longum TaxID=216816 RepID=Q8G5N3_BIFLO|nr:fragment of beta galactosidase [Bifidobacterium longum NCC2705]